MFSKTVVAIERATEGNSNHVLLCIDTICQQENLPVPDIVILTINEEPQVSKRYIPGKGDVQLVLPISILPFISFPEMQMLVHWCYLNFGKIGNSSVSEFITRYSFEDGLGVFIKAKSIQNLWNLFSSSEKYRLLIKNNSSSVLFEFQELLHSRSYLQAVSNTLEQDKLIKRLLNNLSEKQILDFLDKAALAFSNDVFNLCDSEFVQTFDSLISSK